MYVDDLIYTDGSSFRSAKIAMLSDATLQLRYFRWPNIVKHDSKSALIASAASCAENAFEQVYHYANLVYFTNDKQQTKQRHSLVKLTFA